MKNEARDWGDILRRLAPLLPADLFDRLRTLPSPAALPAEERRSCADALQQAIGDLDALHHKLTTFLPRYLLDLSSTPGEPHGELLEGSFIFADVTGFTALTGELSRRGAEGLEEMNRLMRALFGALLDPLLASGGDLLIFAGDAVLACFPAQPDGQDAHWATRTALRMVRAIAPFAHLKTPYGDFSLTMSAGVERGEAFAALVGARRRMELLVSGGPVQGAMAAEGEAGPSQVFAGPNARSFLRPGEFEMQGGVVVGVQTGDLDDYEVVPPARRRSRLSAIFSRRIPDLLEHLERALAQVESLVPFIPPDLFNQIARGEDIRQHPPVAIQFVNLLGVEALALGPAGPERAAAVLQRYFVQAQEIVADREGIISQVDPYARGFTLLNPFGAPTHHEGVPRLAASAALELAHLLERVNREFDLHPPLTQRTGLTYDRIFTGEIGYRHRREYVVAGPAVNLSARLMSKAEPGQIVLDTATWEAVQEDFHADPLPAISLKGIPDPVPRFNLRRLRKGQGFHITDYPLAGRREELARLEKRLDEAAAGQGGAMALIGEAGIGKSRLVTALTDAARRRDMVVLTGRCRPFAHTTPYRPWKDLVARWFDLDEDAPPDVRRRLLGERLAQFDLASSHSAFAQLLGLPSSAGHTPRPSPARARQGPGLFASLEQKTRSQQADLGGWAALLSARAAGAETTQTGDERPSIWDVLKERASIPQALRLALERQAFRQPTLVIVEDLQWIDPDSREIVEAVAAASTAWPLFLLLTARQDTGWQDERLMLSPLSAADDYELAAFALRATRLEPDLADWLHARAGGRPLFVLSYCRALRDAGAVTVDPASDEARWNGPPPPLPLSLQELLLAQVDRLGREGREALRRGVVIGDTFSSSLLAYLCRDALSPHQLNEALEQSARRSLIAPPPPEETHAFSSQSLHDAIYSTLSHALRRTWHGWVGERLAQADEPTRYERLEQIAYHYSRSDDAASAARFTRLAGDKARARQAYEAALSFYTQTLSVAGGGEIAAERRLAHEFSGDVHALRGEGEPSVAAYRAALQETPPEDVASKRRLKARLAMLAPLEGVVEPALLEEARRTLPAADPVRPWLATALVWLRAARGEKGAAVALCRELLPTAAGPLGTLLREGLESLEAGEPLPPYADFFALFARSCLRETG